MFNITNQLCKVNKWMAMTVYQSRVACRDFLGLWLLKTQKKFVFLTDNGFWNFLEVEVKLNTRRKIESYILDLGNGMFSQLITKIDNWKICHRLFVAIHVEIFILSVRKKSITANFENFAISSSWALSRFTTVFF